MDRFLCIHVYKIGYILVPFSFSGFIQAYASGQAASFEATWYLNLVFLEEFSSHTIDHNKMGAGSLQKLLQHKKEPQ
jgi:hypothetical protein